MCGGGGTGPLPWGGGCELPLPPYLTLNLRLLALQLLQLDLQALVLRSQELRPFLQPAALLLGPSQLVAVYLVLCVEHWGAGGHTEVTQCVCLTDPRQSLLRRMCHSQ